MKEKDPRDWRDLRVGMDAEGEAAPCPVPREP
jgi:hypothetical protein